MGEGHEDKTLVDCYAKMMLKSVSSTKLNYKIKNLAKAEIEAKVSNPKIKN